MNPAWDTCCEPPLERIWFERKQKHHPETCWSVTRGSGNSLNPFPCRRGPTGPIQSLPWLFPPRGSVSSDPSEMAPLHLSEQRGMAWRGKCHPMGAEMPVGHAFACQAAIPRILPVWGPTQLRSVPDLSLGTPRRAFLVSSPRMEADLTSVVLSQASPP